jgi:hypothetical protein
MTVQEAYRNITKTLDKMVVMSCHEYDSVFVFHLVPPDYATKELASEVFDSLYSVSKDTGEIKRFTPFDIPLDEYKRGKRITIYDHK